MLEISREQILKVYEAGPEAVVDLVTSLVSKINELTAIVEKQSAEIAQLQNRVKHLENQLNQNSRNSGKPPSSDGYKRPQPKSLRTPGVNKPGGQPGHPGNTLRMSDTPDHVIVQSPAVCSCGCDLTHTPAKETIRRQVFDLPPMKLQVTEYQVTVKQCPQCGTAAKPDFPAGVTAPVQYGPGLKSLAVYLNQYQFLPLKRIREFMLHLFGHPLGEAAVLNACREIYEQLAGTEKSIVDQLLESPVAHFDETGLRVKKKLSWLHVTGTSRFTYYAVHKKRGVDAFEDIGILPRFTGTAVHDAWPSYFQYANCHHALCNAHLLRELTFIHEQEKQKWAKAMIDLLMEMNQDVNQKRVRDQAPGLSDITAYTARYDKIVQDGLEEEAASGRPAKTGRRGRIKQSKSKNLLDRLQMHPQEVLGFLCDMQIPFDNNQAERDIRMMKVQQKISGTFRSDDGARIFCRIRGYLSTARKNTNSIFTAVQEAMEGRPLSFT